MVRGSTIDAVKGTAAPVAAEAGNLWHWASVQVYRILLWTTSWVYWGTGLYLGLLAGGFYGLRKYGATLLTDAFDWLGRKPPAGLSSARKAPEPSGVPVMLTKGAAPGPAVTTTASAAATPPVSKASNAAKSAADKLPSPPKPAYPPVPTATTTR